MKNFIHLIVLIIFIVLLNDARAQKKENIKIDTLLSEKTFSDLKFRSIGPAFMSGRIADIAIHPDNPNIWYIAVGSGGVWKTENSGISWKPLFDKQSVYSIGCITIDPNNSHTIWVGTGENVGGRHVGFGDGIYRSLDDGNTWENMGLKKSEHISKIIIHPENQNIIWVASQGPLWSKGGERGFFKSIDGGKTWKQTLGDIDWTGVTDIAIDPSEPKVLYAVTWQRHRTVAAYMGGGPETAIYRSDDGGDTWKKLSNGLPKSSMGKIGLAISPQQNEVIYAAIELDRRKGAFYKSTNRGESWVKQSETVSGGTGPHYYQELYASPHQFDLVYLADVRFQVSDDGGKTFRRMKEEFKHSDNHALAFKKNDPNYLLVGTDGGLYESFDLEQNWRFINNLPVTQFYKIALDDSKPFYMVYGGTQDNSTQGGPSRTDNVHGIANYDWEIVLFADGHQPATEPGNPDIMYAEWQEGNLVRIDRTTGEIVYIQPQPEANENYERFNWDSPILVSPHSSTRLYFASQRVWRSDNRGDEWKPISGDLTSYQERISMPIMGKKQSWDAAWDFFAMSTYNTITSLAESPKKEGLIYAGTDDGAIQITEDGGKNWRRIPVSSLPGVPATAFVNDIKADLFDANTVYVALDNHKYGDFQPYLYKSSNMGKSWKAIQFDLPKTLIVWRLVQDFVNPNLLFIGTEFGIYFSVDGGAKWIKFGGTPTISFRDLAIQKRENDLVAASFGRGIYILDDYSALRNINENVLKQGAKLFSPRKAWWYIERTPLGDEGKGSMGEGLFMAKNPPFGAEFTYYLHDDFKKLSDIRKEKENPMQKENLNVDFPGWETLDAEINQMEPVVWLNVLDTKQKLVNKIKAGKKRGVHRVAWDLTRASKQPIRISQTDSRSGRRISGPLVAPGKYMAFLSKEIDGNLSTISDTVEFEVAPLRKGVLPGSGFDEVAAFWNDLSGVQSEISAFNLSLSNNMKKVKAMYTALERSGTSSPALVSQLHKLRNELLSIEKSLEGSTAKNEIGEKGKPTISQRLFVASMGTSNSTYGPTPTHKRSLEIAKTEFALLKTSYDKIINETIPNLEKLLKDTGAPIIEGQKINEK